jgi:hypothetical protein
VSNVKLFFKPYSAINFTETYRNAPLLAAGSFTQAAMEVKEKPVNLTLWEL